MSEEKGLVYIFTGDGKGKTSAALGVAMRAVGHGKRVAMIQWYKSGQWNISEFHLPEYFGDNLRIYPMGKGFHLVKAEGRRSSTLRDSDPNGMKEEGRQIKTAPLKGGGVVVDTASEGEHRRAAQEALHLAKELLSSKLKTHNPKLFLLILDEVINALNDNLFDLPTLLDLLELRGSTHLILTGRGAPQELIEIADLVTEMKNVKHPHEKGRKAVLGLDF